jgi:hypothetical protein
MWLYVFIPEKRPVKMTDMDKCPESRKANKTVGQTVQKTRLLNQCAVKSAYDRLFGRIA